MRDFKAILKQIDGYTINHVYREGNRAAEYLAKMGHSAQHGTTILQHPPPGLQLILDGDTRGQFVLRYV